MLTLQDKNLLILPNDFGLATDFYELTMAAAYFYSKQTDRKGIFELFVRKLPRNRSYMVAAGLEQALNYLLDLRFNDNTISYLQSNETFKDIEDDFYEYLRSFKFTGTVWAVPEGSILFPNEPVIRVEAPIIESQIVETFLLSTINFESLIASKASRITDVAKEKSVIEFGFRRAHGPQASVLAARASFIAGCVGSSNTLAGYKLGMPIFGTMAHSFIMNFDKEIEAFEKFSNVFPNALLLVDTYDTIEAVKKITKSGIRTRGIRLDSGDLYSLSIQARKILDDAGYSDTKIMASGDLNEYIIQDLVKRGAPIDYFGVGTELTTSRDDPAMNGVYKLVAVEIPETDTKSGSKLMYKIKTSPGKKTYPGPKQIYRIFSNGLIKKDIIGLEEKEFSQGDTCVPQLRKFMENGKLLFDLPSIWEIQKFHLQQRNTLPPEFRRIDFTPVRFPVFYSENLEKITRELKPA